MTALANLKLTATKKPQHQPAIVQRRNKLGQKLWEQMELAKAVQAGGTYAGRRYKTVVDADGVRKTVEATKRIRPWWFVAENGKLCVNVRYGSKVLELAKGKTAVEIAGADELVSTLDIIKSAVEAGELDAQIEAASGSLRAGFKR